MNNLVIGNSSQLSYFFPDYYIKISSRDINYTDLKKNHWDRIFICLGESRKYITDESLYDYINFHYTKSIIDELKDYANKIIVYSTCELWNKYNSSISLENNFSFFETPYLISKYKMTKYVMNNYDNVLVMFPFNFNSIYRNNNFLFGKIFDSILNKKKITIGDTYFYRDIVHPKFVVKESIESTNNKLIGSGRMVFVNDFIRDLYESFNLDYSEFVVEELNKYKEYIKLNEYYLKTKICLYSYSELLNDTCNDILNYGRTN